MNTDVLINEVILLTVQGLRHVSASQAMAHFLGISKKLLAVK